MMKRFLSLFRRLFGKKKKEKDWKVSGTLPGDPKIMWCITGTMDFLYDGANLHTFMLDSSTPHYDIRIKTADEGILSFYGILKPVTEDRKIQFEGDWKLLNEENIRKVLIESDGQVTVGQIAEKIEATCHAVYRFLRKYPMTGIGFGKLPEPDYQECNVSVWMEGKQKVSEPEVAEVPDAPESEESTGSPEENRDPADLF